MSTAIKVGQVFVPGGKPTVTYVPRSDLQLEDRLKDYLAERYSILSVSGPTKTGKTVLLKSTVDGGLWLSGGMITRVDDFWEQLADQLGLSTETGLDGSLSSTETDSMQGGGNVGVLSGNLGHQDSVARGRSTVSRRRRSPAMASREALDGTDQVLIVDDFHYIDQATQLAIVRGLKDLIFGGLGVILAAVPHRAYDAVRVEKEMTGRVTQLPVGFWGLEDLASIAQSGFAALNVRDPHNLRDRLAREAFQSPHLMQDFCRALCKANGVETTLDVPFDLQEPEWNDFFVSRAPDTSKAAFDLLARGPRQRTDRKPRTLASGVDTDIYGAVLRAIAHTGPLTSITYETLRAALREIMSSEPPQRHEVTRVLEEMAKIAREQIEGEPVVDYDDQLATLFISDPYFAYWLRWGSHRTE